MNRVSSFFLVISVLIGFVALLLFREPLLGYLIQNSGSEITRLKLENEALHLQLASVSSPTEALLIDGLFYKPAFVYSTYPLNNQKILSVSAGSEDRVENLMPVAIGPDLLVGQVIQVFPKYSIVRTIFDPEFKVPVRIGKNGTDALFEGGNSPIINLINKNVTATSGEAIYTAGLQFPFGMKIANFGSWLPSSDSFFKKAEAKLNFNLNDIKEVYIIMNYVSSH